MKSAETTCDVLIVGGGPAGATAALVLARAGLRVRVLERTRFPRFHIGESLLPRNFDLFRELGIAEEVAALPQVPKFGADFAMGHGRSEASFTFDMGLLPGYRVALNIERAPFDALLLDLATQAGAEIAEGVALRSIERLNDGDVAATTSTGESLTARWLVDASGQSTVIGKHLGLRRVLPHLKKVAYFGHFDNVERLPGPRGGSPLIVMCEEGWFWLIPLDETRTSIGLVMHHDQARKAGLPPDEMLNWGIARTPVLREKTARATFPTETHVAADFSYRCEPYAGPGYFLAGDAATFVDPIFSTGVCLGMMSANQAARTILDLEAGRGEAERARREYIRFISRSSSAFFRMVDLYYTHSFRELFLGGGSPFKIHNAILSILAGNVFPRPAFRLRWRLSLLSFLVRLHRFVPLVQSREPFSLLAAPPPAAEASATPGG